jgi:hypothetical protein
MVLSLDLHRITPSPESRAETPEGPYHVAARYEWILTSEALEALLNHFSIDREEAGRQYELMRLKLVRYFERRSCPLAEDFADEAINRVDRKISEGERINNLPAYFLSVARLILSGQRGSEHATYDLQTP